MGVKALFGFRACLRELGNSNRPVALTARAPDSKSGGWGFESLLACSVFGLEVITDDSKSDSIFIGS